jgi:hypothetical protein
MPIRIHPHMLRHACGYKLANDGHDTRALQHYLGHKNIQHTVRYTELAVDGSQPAVTASQHWRPVMFNQDPDPTLGGSLSRSAASLSAGHCSRFTARSDPYRLGTAASKAESSVPSASSVVSPLFRWKKYLDMSSPN